MVSYQLQAKLKNGGVVDLDFSDFNDSLNQLIEIDRFTNQYDSWDFLSLASTHIKYAVSSSIESIHIAVKRKEYCYSACFKNPYLEEIFNETYLNSSINRHQIPLTTPAFVEMVEFLFSELEKKGDLFFEDYPYKNRLSQKIYRYLNIQLLSEEDLREQRILKQEIVYEMSEYKVYRSLCVYRKTMDRKKNQIPRTIKREDSKSTLGIIPRIPKKIIYEDQEDGVVTQYVSHFENLNGEEREEFLSDDEVQQMVKTYE